MLTIVPNLLFNGVVSVLAAFTEVSPPEPRPAGTPLTRDQLRFTLDGTNAPQGGPVVHCGTPMELVTPAVGWRRASYTFAPTVAGDTELPPVWRCACGFQLDAWPGDDIRAWHASAALPA
jgi:hypothetical protein